MRRVDGSLGTLLQGVSQQPDKERLQGQVTECTNMTADVVRMLSRRPASRFVDSFSIGSVDITKCFVHFYSRGDGEEYYLIVTPGGNLYIVDLDGNVASKTQTAAFTSYITSSDPKRDLRMTTVGDYTFVVNTTKTVAMDTARTPNTRALNKSGIVEVLVGQYSRDYKIKIQVNGSSNFEFTHPTPDSSGGYDADAEDAANNAAAAEAAVATDKIAAELRVLLTDPGSGLASFFSIGQDGSNIKLTPKATVSTFNITVEDGLGGGGMRAITNNTVGSLAQLPVKAQPNAVYKVAGGTGNSDDFYMIFNPNDPNAVGEFVDGVWTETVGPSQEFQLDADTMPHIIRRTATASTFECGRAGEGNIDAWAERVVGDEETNKDPQFVGTKIADVSTFQDRLVILDQEGVNLSVTSDFFNFFKKTVTQLLPDGPIGIASASNQVNILRYAEQHDKDLIIFSDGVQFTLIGTTAITPQNATMVETTKFKIQTEIAPVPSGQNLFFAVNSGVYSGVREFYTDSTFDSNNARPVTIAVERYIEGKIRQMSSATNLSKMGCLADAPNVFYLYEYLWDEGKKVQNAWSQWVFREDMYLFHTEFFDDSLYMLGYVGNDVHIVRIPIQSDVSTTDILTDSIIASDLCIDHSQWKDNINTEITGLGVLPDDVDQLVAVQGEGCPHPGMLCKIESVSNGVATLRRDMQGGSVLVGVKYRSSVTPSRPYMRDESDRPIGTSSLIVGDMLINYAESGDFNVDVTSDYSYTERNPGRILGQKSATIGEFSLTDGQFSVPVRANNDKSSIQIYSESPYPFTVQDIEWTGQFYKRGTRTMRSGGVQR